MSISVLGFAVAFLVAGCGAPTSPPLKEIGQATGLESYSADKYGISIGVAPGFRIGSGLASDVKSPMDSSGAPSGGGGDLSGQVPANLTASLNAMAKQDEEEEKATLAKMEADGIIIRAFQPGGQTIGEDMTKYEVQISPNPASSLEAAANTILEHVPGEEPPVPMQLPIGPAMHIVAHKKMTDGGEVYSSKYVLQDGKTMIVVVFLTEREPTPITVIEKKVIESLRVVPGKAVAPKPT